MHTRDDDGMDGITTKQRIFTVLTEDLVKDSEFLVYLSNDTRRFLRSLLGYNKPSERIKALGLTEEEVKTFRFDRFIDAETGVVIDQPILMREKTYSLSAFRNLQNNNRGAILFYGEWLNINLYIHPNKNFITELDTQIKLVQEHRQRQSKITPPYPVAMEIKGSPLVTDATFLELLTPKTRAFLQPLRGFGKPSERIKALDLQPEEYEAFNLMAFLDYDTKTICDQPVLFRGETYNLSVFSQLPLNMHGQVLFFGEWIKVKELESNEMFLGNLLTRIANFPKQRIHPTPKIHPSLPIELTGTPVIEDNYFLSLLNPQTRHFLLSIRGDRLPYEKIKALGLKPKEYAQFNLMAFLDYDSKAIINQPIYFRNMTFDLNYFKQLPINAHNRVLYYGEWIKLDEEIHFNTDLNVYLDDRISELLNYRQQHPEIEEVLPAMPLPGLPGSEGGDADAMLGKSGSLAELTLRLPLVTRLYYESISKRQKQFTDLFAELPKQVQESAFKEECFDLMTAKLKNVPVLVHGFSYDLESVLKLYKKGMTEPNTRENFTLAQIQPDRVTFNAIQDVFDGLKASLAFNPRLFLPAGGEGQAKGQTKVPKP